MKKLLAITMTLALMLSLMSVASVTVSAGNRTQAEALAWIQARANEGWWEDVDGVYGCQCVDLIQAYYEWFGYSRMRGSAYEYQYDHLPAGSDWYYSGTPIPGCIFVKAAGGSYTYGHVGLVYAVEGSTIYTVETNIASPYDGGYSYARAQYWDRSVGFANTFICPTFKSPISYAGMDVNFWVDGKDQVNIDGIGTIQVYVDGQLQATGTDFNQDVAVGKSYEVKVNITNSNYHFGGVDTYESGYSGLTGTTGSGGTKVRLVIVKDTGGLTTIANGNYQIVSVINNSYGLDISGDNIPCSNRDNVELWPIGSIPRPQDCFTLTNLGNGYYSIKQMDTNMAFDVLGASASRWENIYMFSSHSNNNQQWKICYDSSNGGYTFQSKCSGMYLTVDGGIMEAGRNVYQNIKSSTPKAQAWKLIPYYKDSQDYEYEFINNNAAVRITKYKGADGNITIPSTLGGKPVKEIGADAFFKCTSLTSVTIPNGVISIGEDAFNNCTSLTSITIPNSVTSIGDYAFYGSHSLTSVTIPNSVTSIGEGTFGNCISLNSITIPNGVTTIGESAFFYCTSLTSVTIPNTVTTIDDHAFWNCSLLTTVYYGGTKTNRDKITIGSYNQPLLNATWVYQNEPGDDPSQPTEPTQTLIYRFTFENGGDNILKKYDDWETMSYTSFGEIVEWPVGSGNHALRYQLNTQTHTGAGLHPYIWPKGIDEILIAQGDLAAGETYELTIDIANTGNTAGSYMYPFLLCNGVYDDESYFDKTSFSPAAAFQTHTFVLSSLVAEPMAGAESGGIAFVDEQTLDDGSYMYIDNVTLVKKGTWKPIPAGARATYLDGTPAEMGIVGTASPTSSSEPSVEPSNEPGDEPSDEPSDVSDLPGGTGDANGDGSTDMKDVLFARKFIAGMGVDVDEDALDVNRDGSVDMKDVLLMRKFIAGLIDKLPRTTA